MPIIGTKPYEWGTQLDSNSLVKVFKKTNLLIITPPEVIYLYIYINSNTWRCPIGDRGIDWLYRCCLDFCNNIYAFADEWVLHLLYRTRLLWVSNSRRFCVSSNLTGCLFLFPTRSVSRYRRIDDPRELQEKATRFGCVLWHKNLCDLFSAKSCDFLIDILLMNFFIDLKQICWHTVNSEI